MNPFQPIPPAAGPPTVLILYARADVKLVGELWNHLASAERAGDLVRWMDRSVLTGQRWHREIQAQLLAARIIVPLVSSDFLASDYVNEHELPIALQRWNDGTARVLPVLARPVELLWHPLGELQHLPPGGKAVSQWKPRDPAWRAVAREVWAAARDLRATPRTSPPP